MNQFTHLKAFLFSQLKILAKVKIRNKSKIRFRCRLVLATKSSFCDSASFGKNLTEPSAETQCSSGWAKICFSQINL